jgi:glutathione S-transferase
MTTQQPSNLVLCELTDPKLASVESYSPFCLKVHRALRAAGLRYERRFADRPDAWKHFNPTGQVPVLLVDGQPVSDSTRILQRIDDMTGALTRGLDARQRAEAWLWDELADSGLSGFLVAARWLDDDNWPLVRDAFFGRAPWFVQRIIAPKIRKNMVSALIARDVWRQGPQACWERHEILLDQLEARCPTRGFWVSDTLSVADLALFAQLQSLRTPLTRKQAEQVALRKQLSSYLERVDIATRDKPAESVLRKAAAGGAHVAEG